MDDFDDVPFGVEVKPAKPAQKVVDPTYRSIPHSVEAERGTLGCILLDPQPNMALCLEKVRVAETWYDLRHRSIWTALLYLYEQKTAIDAITLQQRLKDQQELDAVGGLAYIMGLGESVPSAANISYYLDIVLDKYLIRSSIRECVRLSDLAYEWEESADEYLDAVQQTLNTLAIHRYRANVVSVKVMAQECVADIERALEQKKAIDGIPTGFTDLDKLCCGLHPKELIILAGRTSTGKSSLAFNVAEHIALDLKLAVGIFSLEMAAKSIVYRMICSRGRVNSRNIREGFLSERDFPKISKAAGMLAGAPIYIDDERGGTSLQIRAKARRMQQDYGIKVFIIDYLQLVHSPRHREKRHNEVADVANDLQTLAGELNTPVIALSQLNRELDKDKGRRPRLSDLSESGTIENNADTVWMLYNKKRDEEGGRFDSFDARPVGLVVGKQRHGPTGEIDLTFCASYTRFESAALVTSEPPEFNAPYKDT